MADEKPSFEDGTSIQGDFDCDMSGDGESRDDESLERPALATSTSLPTPEKVVAPPMQVAVSPDDGLPRSFELLEAWVQGKFNYLKSKVCDLEQKYSELSAKLSEFSHTSDPASPSSVDPPTLPQQCGLVPGSHPKEEEGQMLLEESLLDTDVNGLLPISSNPSVPRSTHPRASFGPSEPYNAPNIDNMIFHPLDAKLDNKEGFKYWRQSILGQLQSHDCTFLIDPSEPVPPTFSTQMVGEVMRKVKHFIFESLSPQFQYLVSDIQDPKAIMDKVHQTCEPSSPLQLQLLIKEFNSLKYDPQTEQAIEFLGRFDNLTSKLNDINPNVLTPAYVKLMFENAILFTSTHKKAEVCGFTFSLAELRDMLVEEQLQSESLAGEASSFSSIQVASSRGRGMTPPFRGRGNPAFFWNRGAAATFRGRGTMATFRGRGAVATFRGRGMPANLRGRGTPVTLRGRGASTRGTGAMVVASQTVQPKSKAIKKTFCTYCKKRGHTKDNCLKSRKLCFICSGEQHMASECPQAQGLNTNLC